MNNAAGEVQEGRAAMARDVLGFDDGDAQTFLGSDSAFSTVRRLAKVVVSLGQVLASFTRV